jgi:hypothetical protein
MKSIFKLIIVALFTVSLTGCIGENYDFTPPTVTISTSMMSSTIPQSLELKEATINWKGENNKPIEKETEDFLALAKEQKQFYFFSEQLVDLQFDSEDFAVNQLLVSVWKNDEIEGTNLELNDDRSFQLPKEKGEYVILVDLQSDRGTAQYVGNIVIKQVEVSETSVEEKDVREAVWDQLPSDRKEQIKGTWKDAKVKKETLNNTVIKFTEPPKNGEFFVVDFQTKSNSTPNNMIVYANVEDYKIIGYGLVD